MAGQKAWQKVRIPHTTTPFCFIKQEGVVGGDGLLE
jgi:hypothetical protein